MSQQSEDPSSILFNFDSASNIVNFDEDYEDDSDGTLLGDEFEDRFVRPTPEVIFLRDRDIPSNFEDNTDKRLGSYSFNNRTFRPGKTVELVSGDFLRITAIVHDVGSHSVCLKGIKFRRNKELNGLVEFKRNEVTMLMSFDDDDPRDIHHQSIETVQLREVVRLRELIKTNLPFPKYSFRESDENWRSQGKEYVMQHSRLLCRTKLIRRSNSEGTLQTLGEGETDEGYRTDDSQLRCDFRGETEKGGICARWLDGERDFDERERVRVQDIDLLNFSNYYNTWARNNSQQRRYTFGDAFCGAGGASRGAKAVGLRVDWGFDFDPAAIDSYRRNFHKTRCEAIAAHEFVTVITEDFKIDILHLSPPCQTFSPMHSRQGKNDELNQGTFFAVEELLKKVKPRIVTLEETFGLTRTLDNLDWFHAMIQVFTKLGFSVRWKIFNLCDFGLPQPRKRLFVFASCPGEPLPDFPTPTHCKAADRHRFPNLLPFTTVNDTIARIPRGFSLHNPDQVTKRNDAPYQSNLPLQHTILCAGNHDFHPSGKRNFTLRELACLQGFPLEHEFGPTRTRIQIGNAVPPVVARVFFDHIRRHLLGVDGLA